MGESPDGDKEGLGAGIAVLSGAIRAQFLIAVLTGIVLAIGYSPQIATAHARVAAMHEGWIRPIQSLHYWVTAVLIVETVALVVAYLWSGRYTRRFGLPFDASLLLAISAFLFQVTGNLLPYDRHGVETAVIEIGIAARLPGLGPAVQRILQQGQEFGPDTLRFWYALHVSLVVLLALGFAMDLRGKKQFASETINGRVVAGICLIPFVLAFLRSPLGSVATAVDASTFADKPSWYTWPFHGLLGMFDHFHQGSGWIGAMLLPGLAVVFLLALPWLGMKPPIVLIRSGTAVVAVFTFCAALLYGGTFDPLTGTRDPALMPVAATTGRITPIDRLLAAKGATEFQSAGCAGCHGPTGDEGGAGPSLKTVGKQYPEPDFYLNFIQNPKSVNPQSTMPPFPDLTQEELRALAEYLRGKGR